MADYKKGIIGDALKKAKPMPRFPEKSFDLPIRPEPVPVKGGITTMPLPKRDLRPLPVMPRDKVMPLPNIKVPAPSNSDYWSVNPDSKKNRYMLDLENKIDKGSGDFNYRKDEALKAMRERMKPKKPGDMVLFSK